MNYPSLLVFACIAIISGCAADPERSNLQEQIDQVRQAAEQALQSAEAAQTEAANAAVLAGEAKASADSADSCCAATDEKIDRMFEQSQYK